MSSEKKPWIKPQLIILGRGEPEESVLTHCKRIDPIGSVAGPLVSSQYVCDDDKVKNCGNCQARAGS